MKKFLKFFLISLGILILTPFLIIGFYELFPAKIHNQTVSGFSAGFLSNLLKVNVTGILFRDQVWSGEIYVSGPLVIVPWVTLKIEPGTVVKFKHSRDYKNPLRGGLIIKGTLQAIGTPEQPIWFTSDAPEPINGDWESIFITSQKENIIKYAIVEYAQLGINFWTASGEVSHSIIRWVNSECIYMERSNPVIEYNTIYNCGYNGIALEQFNYDVKIRYNKIFDNLYNTGIHGEATEVEIEGNIVKNNKFGITFDDFSEAVIKNNLIENNSEEGIRLMNSCQAEVYSNLIKNNGLGISCDLGDSQIIIHNNDISENQNDFYIGEGCQSDLKNNQEKITIPEPVFDYQDIKKTDLGYCPGDPNDKYPYIYPTEDETRKVIKRIVGGIPISFGWSLGWDGQYLWKFRHAGAGNLMKINPQSGEIIASFENPGIAQDHGIAFDGQSLWINDFSALKVFEVDPNNGKILSSFKIPEMGGGASGIAWDGQYLYLVSWLDQNTLYQIDRKGNLISTLRLKGPAGQTITFDGEYFWVSCNQWICKYDRKGNLKGKIYSVAWGTWAMAHDGKYLWTLQRTNENWTDPKVYQIEILDDTILLEK
ncbi:right-handed parallel beta-helix repeat-containing protein [Patescibacteria group bacterium]|nr:right-handed parallel beta-helix repeat-containing protein [Patescibacteria group bacterium]